MTVERITYSRTKNINHSENECIEISIDIDSKDEDEKEAALEYLRAWVENKMQVREKTAKLASQRNDLQRQIHALEDDLQAVRNKVGKANEFLQKLGLATIDEIPF